MERSVIKQRWSLFMLLSFLGFFLFVTYHADQSKQLATVIAPVGSSSTSGDAASPPPVTDIGAPSSSTTKNIKESKFALPLQSSSDSVRPNITEAREEPSTTANATVTANECDIFDGEWVYEPSSYPLYKVHQCPFLSDQVSCQRNGRPDSGYERWRWKPRGCDVTFNGTLLLDRLRGKRVAIVGDSLNRNQWESLTCLLYSSIHPSRAVVRADDPRIKIFRALDYDFSLEFYWSPFLVKLKEARDGSRVLKLDELAEMGRWMGASVMVFNTGHWWNHHGRPQTWDSYEFHGKEIRETEAHQAFKMGIETWARWIDRIVNPNRTTVFFRSISPEHKPGNLQWCHNQTQPIVNETYRRSFPETMISTVEETIGRMKTPVRYLNITRMSEYRRDAHAALYTTRQGKLLTEDERKQPEQYADCSHWCLPGLPDTWNVLLYASIVGAGSPAVL